MFRLIRNIFPVLLGCLALLASASSAAAHPARIASGIAVVHPDGKVDIELNFDVLAYLLNDTPSRISDDLMYGLLDGPTSKLEEKAEQGRRRFARAIRVIVGETEIPFTVGKFPTAAQIAEAGDATNRIRLPVVLKASGSVQLPHDTTSIRFGVADVLDTVILTVERDDHEPIALALQAGSPSSALGVKVVANGNGPEVASDQSKVQEVPITEDPSHWSVAGRYIILGFEHILPLGLDHILFVLGLFLLSPKLKPLLWQVTSFTLAHSITLGLAMFGLVKVSGAIVEPIIALSIAFIAIENLWTSKLKPWRPAVIFIFGLVHGLGFAGVLADLGLPRSAFVPALISFNVGVELGQLAIIGLAFCAVGWARNRQWYRPAVVWPASIAIAAMGLYWTVERVFV